MCPLFAVCLVDCLSMTCTSRLRNVCSSKQSVSFLGYRFSVSGVEMENDRISAVPNWPTPKLKLRPCAFFSKKLSPAEGNYDVRVYVSSCSVCAQCKAVERVNQDVGRVLRSYCQDGPGEWAVYIPWVEMAQKLPPPLFQ